MKKFLTLAAGFGITLTVLGAIWFVYGFSILISIWWARTVLETLGIL